MWLPDADAGLSGVEYECCGVCFSDREECAVLSQKVLFHSAEYCVPMAAIQMNI